MSTATRRARISGWRSWPRWFGPERRRFLDIGSGSGEILYMARKAGFEVTGVEPNTGYAEYTREELGLPVQNCTFEEADLPKAHFDILNLSHVLEHLPDPLASLRFLNTLLRPGGILCVAVPDIGHASHAPWTRFHYAHIHNFSHETLKAMVLKAGFEILPQSSGSTDADRPQDGGGVLRHAAADAGELRDAVADADGGACGRCACRRQARHRPVDRQAVPLSARPCDGPADGLAAPHPRQGACTHGAETYGTLMTFVLAAV